MNVRYDYAGKVVLVTGGARGQGRSHALGFAAAGADVAICDIGGDIEAIPYELGTEAELEEVAADIESLDVRCVRQQCDVRDREQVDALVKRVEAELGAVDILIHNAGVTSAATVEEISDEVWDAVSDTHVRGALNFARATIPAMKERGSGKILITGSVESFIGLPRNAHYASAKHALLGLMRSLAIDLAPHGINVNMVCPGGVDTPMLKFGDTEPEWMAETAALTGAWNLFNGEEMLRPEDITNAMLWLASDGARRVTGVAVPVDAGFLLT